MTTAEILKPICSKDATRTTIAEPFGADFEGRRWTFATNGWVCVGIAADFPTRDKAPDPTQILFSEPTPTHRVSVPLLREWAGPIPPPPPPPSNEKRTVDCEECDGTGEVTCYHCDRDGAECEDCDGTGKVEEDVDPPPTIEPRYGALLKGALDRLLLAHVLATLPPEATEIHIGHREELAPYILRAPDWIAAIMPVRGVETKERFDSLVAA